MTAVILTPETLDEAVAKNRVADHPWFKERFLTGRATREGTQALAVQLIGFFDSVIRLYGPMYMNNADYKIRRLFVDKMLTPIKLGVGSPLRLGEGAHAHLARQLAHSLGISAEDAQQTTGAQLMQERFEALMSTLARPAYWVSLGACAAVESQMRNVYEGMAEALQTHYRANGKSLDLFRAPLLFAASDVDHAIRQCKDHFARLRLIYYTNRIRDEWYECWDACFRTAAG